MEERKRFGFNCIGEKVYGIHTITDLDFTDDLAVLAEDIEQAHEVLSRLEHGDCTEMQIYRVADLQSRLTNRDPVEGW